MSFSVLTLHSSKRAMQHAQQMTGEHVAPGLAITPVYDRYEGDPAGQFTGWWTITHIPSGLRLVGGSPCLYCVREMVVLAVASGVDWDRDDVAIKADLAAVRAADKMREVMYHCGAHDCMPTDEDDDDLWEELPDVPDEVAAVTVATILDQPAEGAPL